jgi:DnaK suppressor protein
MAMTPELVQDYESDAALEQRLQADRKLLITRIGRARLGSYELTATHGHGETELAARDGQQTIDAALEADMLVALEAIDAALERVADGTFGLCVSCGQSIASERLEILPAAARCVTCEQRMQRQY